MEMETNGLRPCYFRIEVFIHLICIVIFVKGEQIVCGSFRAGRLVGRTTVEDLSECSKTELIHRLKSIMK